MVWAFRLAVYYTYSAVSEVIDGKFLKLVVLFIYDLFIYLLIDRVVTSESCDFTPVVVLARAVG